MLPKDRGLIAMALDSETHQTYQIDATNENAKVQGGLALIVSKRNGVAVEKVEYDKKEGRWIRALLAIGGAEKCWVGVAYGVAGPCATKQSTEHSGGVVENWCETIRGGRQETPNCIWLADSNFVRDASIDRKKILLFVDKFTL